MADLEYSGPNAEQIKYWNEVSGPKWAALGTLIDAQVAPLGRRAMDRAALRTGERVLDVGCGCGETSIEIARRVGPTGAVTGVDLSRVMLERARASARQAGVTNVRFENADAQTYQFAADGCDVLFSRFGVMFFADPVAAFVNLRTALRPGARVTFLCWQRLQENQWLFVPLMAAARHIQLPKPSSPDAPGPFAFADAERVRGILSRAGFVDIAFEDARDTLGLGGANGVDLAVEFVLQVGPTAAALRDAGADKQGVVRQAVRDALSPFATPHGVRLGCAAWIVTAIK